MEPIKEQTETFGAKTASMVYSVTTGQFLSTVITLAMFIALTRMLQPQNYGLYAFAIGYATLIDAVSGFGVGAYFSTKISINMYKKDSEQIFRVIRSGFAILLPVAAFLTLFGIALSPYIADVAFKGVGIGPLTLMLASATIFFTMLQGTASHALIGFGKSWYFSLVGTIVNVIQLVISILLIYLGYGVNGAIAGLLVGYMVGSVLGVYYLLRFSSRYGKFRFIMPARKDIKAAFSFSAPIGVNRFLTSSLQNFSIILLGLYVVTATLGNYGAAMKGYNFMFFVYGTMTTILVPAFSIAGVVKERGTLHTSYNSLLRYSMLLTLPLIVYPAVFAGPGVYLFISRSYATAGIFLSLISLGTAIGIVNSYLDSMMLAAGKTRKTMVYNTISGIIQLALLVTVVPYVYAASGHSQLLTVIAAILSVFFVGNIISNVLFQNGVRKHLGVSLKEAKILRVFAANAVLGVILLAFLVASGTLLSSAATWLQDVAQLVAGITITMIVYPMLTVFFRALDREDLKTIGASTAKLPLIKKPIALFLGYTAHFLPS